MLPIPGTSQVLHLDDNMQSVNILLDEDEFEELSSGGKNAHRPQR
jgi:aryl-alcohol dehydrogenase-like predicted oxidoreductase